MREERRVYSKGVAHTKVYSRETNIMVRKRPRDSQVRKSKRNKKVTGFLWGETGPRSSPKGTCLTNLPKEPRNSALPIPETERGENESSTSKGRDPFLAKAKRYQNTKKRNVFFTNAFKTNRGSWEKVLVVSSRAVRAP